MGVNAGRRMWQFFFARNFFRELIIRPVTFQRRFADKPAAFDAEVLLRNRKRIRAADFGHASTLDPRRSCDGKIRIGNCSQEITIEAGLLRDSRSLLERSARVRKLVKLRHLPRVTQRDGKDRKSTRLNSS